jgi:hypothetical protein
VRTSTKGLPFQLRGLGWRIHCGVEVTESNTNKQHIIALSLCLYACRFTRAPLQPAHCLCSAPLITHSIFKCFPRAYREHVAICSLFSPYSSIASCVRRMLIFRMSENMPSALFSPYPSIASCVRRMLIFRMSENTEDAHTHVLEIATHMPRIGTNHSWFHHHRDAENRISNRKHAPSLASLSSSPMLRTALPVPA